ncbi:MAG: aromatic ring-hydroxylating dioxygenase subunit alpha [Acidimicrobiales bacterium]
MFVGHESEVAEPGEFVTRLLGRQPVVLTRDEDGETRLWSNRCPHRGATVCNLDRGRTRYFRCPYHARTFDTGGALVALPGEEGFGPTFDRAEHGWRPSPHRQLPRVRCSEPVAHRPHALEHLGDACDMIDRLCDLSPVGEITLRAGWLRHRIRANWKMAAENVCDFYHPPITHASSGLAAGLPPGYFSDAYGGVVRDLGGGRRGRLPADAGQRQAPVAGEVQRCAPPTPGSAGGTPRRRRRGGPGPGRAATRLHLPQPVHRRGEHLRHPAGERGRDDPPADADHVGGPSRGAAPPPACGASKVASTGRYGRTRHAATWERIQLGLRAGEPEWVVLERGVERDGTGVGRALDEIAMRGFWHHYRSIMTDQVPG